MDLVDFETKWRLEVTGTGFIGREIFYKSYCPWKTVSPLFMDRFQNGLHLCKQIYKVFPPFFKSLVHNVVYKNAGNCPDCRNPDSIGPIAILNVYDLTSGSCQILYLVRLSNHLCKGK